METGIRTGGIWKIVGPFIFGTVLCSCAVGRYAPNADYPVPCDGYVPEGHLQEVFVKTSVRGPHERRMLVYLPEDYFISGQNYPVLYLLHGARGNETSWIMKGRILENIDSLTACGAMKKTIVVFPNMNRYDDDQDYGKSRLKNAFESVLELDGSVEAAFAEDVVGTVDGLFRTRPRKEDRALAGLSVGAFQVMHISASRPDMFGYVGLFSPFVRTVVLPGEYSGFLKGLWKKIDRQFADPPCLYSIMMGRDDVLYPRIQEFLSRLRRKGLGFEYVESSGGHDWPNWQDYSIIFMKSLWSHEICPQAAGEEGMNVFLRTVR